MSGTISDFDLCTACVEQAGLCERHAKHVLPQLAEPAWYRHAHSGMYFETGKHKPSPEAQRKAARKARRAERRAARMRPLTQSIELAA